MMTEVAGFPVSAMTLIMVLCGAGMCIGNLLGGRLSDKYTPARVILATQVLMFSALVVLFFGDGARVIAVAMTVLCCAGLFAVSSPQQHLIIKHAPGGEMMGGAMIQIAFNLGNAIGAYFGGLPIDSGAGVRYSTIIGAAFIALGILSAFLLLRRIEPKREG